MDVFLNGEFVSEESAMVSVFDRGFMYGDGAFETLRVYNGKPYLLDRHLGRLTHTLGTLGIAEPMNLGDLLRACSDAIRHNGITDGILRIQVTRGAGKRGYSSSGHFNPTLLITSHEAPPIPETAPPPVRLITATAVGSAHDPFSTLKTTNKLVNITAMQEAERADAQDALLLNHDGSVTETSSSNLFAICGNALQTPPLNSGCLAGITRGCVMEIAIDLKIPVAQENLTVGELVEVDGLFLTNSVQELISVGLLDGAAIAQSSLFEKIWTAYRKRVLAATA